MTKGRSEHLPGDRSTSKNQTNLADNGCETKDTDDRDIRDFVSRDEGAQQLEDSNYVRNPSSVEDLDGDLTAGVSKRRKKVRAQVLPGPPA